MCFDVGNLDVEHVFVLHMSFVHVFWWFSGLFVRSRWFDVSSDF